jgi:hypothetical protein
MDVIESLDVGVYSFFRQQIASPQVCQVMRIAYFLSDYLSVGILFSLAALFFLLQGKRRSAQVTAISLAVALALLFGMRFLIPRRRPGDGEDFLGPANMIGSFPSSGVFLFMLAMIFLGFATWRLFRPWMRALYIFMATALTVWVCLSQLVLATGYLTDVVGAMTAATLIGWIANRFLDGVPVLPADAHAKPTNVPGDAIQDLSRTHGIQER